ncbi:MAG: hypothetical protein RLZZ265_1903 [Verrucomicrobiota bacterium]
MSQAAPAWVNVLPDEDYQHSFGLKAGRAEKFFAPTERHAELLAQRRHWLRSDTARCAALLPAAEPLLEEAIALAVKWNSLPGAAGLTADALHQAAVVPHPGPLPLGEGAATGARRGTTSAGFASALADGPPLPAGEGRGEGESARHTEGFQQDFKAAPFARCLALGEFWEPDYLLLKPDAVTGRFHLVGGCVCFPSSWRFEEKVGKPLEVIHTPVPHLNDQLASPIHNFLGRIKPGAAWCRTNWGLSRSPELNQHPARGLPKLVPPLREDEVWLRVEDQALVALPESRGVLFGIRMTVIPLAEVKRHPTATRGLARALRTMPDAMLDYKSLLAAKGELVRLLET